MNKAYANQIYTFCKQSYENDENIAMLYISINFYQPIYHLPKN